MTEITGRAVGPSGVRPRRVFVVGCPRSGTTLVQSMLAAHPAVLAFPETHVFRPLRPDDPLRRRLGLRTAAAGEHWRSLAGLGIPVAGRRPPWRVGRYVAATVAVFDAAAVADGRRAWSEKTPGHLRVLRTIRREVPDAHVVHVVREGVATVTSLYTVTQEHGEEWLGERSLDLCLTRWTHDLRRTARAAGQPNQHVVSYESLVADPVKVLTALVAALGLEQTTADAAAAAEGMAAGYRAQAARLAAPGETWKSGVGEELQDRTAAHQGRLTGSEVARVRAAVAEVQPTYDALPFVGG